MPNGDPVQGVYCDDDFVPIIRGGRSTRDSTDDPKICLPMVAEPVNAGDIDFDNLSLIEVAEGVSTNVSGLREIRRVLDGAPTEHDAEADLLTSTCEFKVVPTLDENQNYCVPCGGPFSIPHLALHIP